MILLYDLSFYNKFVLFFIVLLLLHEVLRYTCFFDQIHEGHSNIPSKTPYHSLLVVEERKRSDDLHSFE